MSNKKVYTVTIDTTGLDPVNDEILRISVVDSDGGTVMDELCGTERVESWPGAQRVNLISPESVEGKPTFAEIADRVNAVLGEADAIVGYNMGFDIGFLTQNGVDVPDVKRFDVMKAYAPVHGDWSDYKGDWKWCKLADCARHYGHSASFTGSLQKAQTIVKCLGSMVVDDSEGGYLEKSGALAVA